MMAHVRQSSAGEKENQCLYLKVTKSERSPGGGNG